MLSYVMRRFLYMIPQMVLISIVCFGVISLQPGDFGDQFFDNPRFSPEMVAQMRAQLGLDKPPYMQYLTWMKGIITRGDFGYSFTYNRPVTGLIWERLAWTVFVSGLTMIFTWTVGLFFGVYSATHQYSVGDHFFTFVAFLGLSIPNFLLALVLMYLMIISGAKSVGGLFSAAYIGQPWSWGKFVDLLKHLWIPMVAIGTSGMAGVLRQMRGNLLDVLGMPYIQTARAKGAKERVVIYKHAVRNAINPLVSMIGMELPNLLSGTIISAIVLNLPTMGPFFYDALINQDQYVVMTFLMFSALMLLVGNLLADIALAWIDPKVRYD